MSKEQVTKTGKVCLYDLFLVFKVEAYHIFSIQEFNNRLMITFRQNRFGAEKVFVVKISDLQSYTPDFRIDSFIVDYLLSTEIGAKIEYPFAVKEEYKWKQKN